MVTAPAWHPSLGRVLYLPELPPDLRFPFSASRDHGLSGSPGLSRGEGCAAKPEAFLCRPGRFGEHVAVLHAQKKIFGIDCTTIAAFEVLLKRLANQPLMKGSYHRDGVGALGGFGYCCGRLLEVDFVLGNRHSKHPTNWSFQSFDLRGNVTAKSEDMLVPCWRIAPPTGNR